MLGTRATNARERREEVRERSGVGVRSERELALAVRLEVRLEMEKQSMKCPGSVWG